jgi:hypothetical protein
MKRMLLPAFLLLLTTALPAFSQPASQTGTAALDPGKRIEREISGGEMHAYTLTVPAGGYAHVDVDQIGISVGISVVADEQKLRVVDATGGGVHEVFSLIADARLRITSKCWRPTSLRMRGKYAILVDDSHPATAADKAQMEGEKLFEDGMDLLYKQTKRPRRKQSTSFSSRSRFGRRPGISPGKRVLIT